MIMLKKLERSFFWRDVTDCKPAKTGGVIAARMVPTYQSEPREAYWDGQEFRDPHTGEPLRTVTHWAPFPSLPGQSAMRRVFQAILADTDTREPS